MRENINTVITPNKKMEQLGGNSSIETDVLDIYLLYN